MEATNQSKVNWPIVTIIITFVVLALLSGFRNSARYWEVKVRVKTGSCTSTKVMIVEARSLSEAKIIGVAEARLSVAASLIGSPKEIK